MPFPSAIAHPLPQVLRFTLAVAMASLLACNKETLKPGFEIPFVAELTIPPGINPFDTHYFIINNLTSRYDALLQQNGVTDADISGIATQQAGVFGIFGDENFDFIQEASLRVFSPSNPDDWIEVAYRLPVPLDPGSRLDLIPSLADSKRILQMPRFSAALMIRLRRTPTIESDVRVNFIMRAQYR